LIYGDASGSTNFASGGFLEGSPEDDIKDVKPGGHFLTQMNTIKACRSEEYFAPSLCDRGANETWDELGRPDMYDKAKERVEEILASPPKNPLSDHVIGKLEEIMNRADEALKE